MKKYYTYKETFDILKEGLPKVLKGKFRLIYGIVPDGATAIWVIFDKELNPDVPERWWMNWTDTVLSDGRVVRKRDIDCINFFNQINPRIGYMRPQYGFENYKAITVCSTQSQEKYDHKPYEVPVSKIREEFWGEGK